MLPQFPQTPNLAYLNLIYPPHPQINRNRINIRGSFPLPLPQSSDGERELPCAERFRWQFCRCSDEAYTGMAEDVGVVERDWGSFGAGRPEARVDYWDVGLEAS